MMRLVEGERAAGRGAETGFRDRRKRAVWLVGQPGVGQRLGCREAPPASPACTARGGRPNRRWTRPAGAWRPSRLERNRYARSIVSDPSGVLAGARSRRRPGRLSMPRLRAYSNHASESPATTRVPPFRGTASKAARATWGRAASPAAAPAAWRHLAAGCVGRLASWNRTGADAQRRRPVEEALRSAWLGRIAAARSAAACARLPGAGRR